MNFTDTVHIIMFTWRKYVAFFYFTPKNKRNLFNNMSQTKIAAWNNKSNLLKYKKYFILRLNYFLFSNYIKFDSKYFLFYSIIRVKFINTTKGSKHSIVIDIFCMLVCDGVVCVDVWVGSVDPGIERLSKILVVSETVTGFWSKTLVLKYTTD